MVRTRPWYGWRMAGLRRANPGCTGSCEERRSCGERPRSLLGPIGWTERAEEAENVPCGASEKIEVGHTRTT